MILHILLVQLWHPLVPTVSAVIVDVIDYQQQALQDLFTKSEGICINLLGYTFKIIGRNQKRRHLEWNVLS